MKITYVVLCFLVWFSLFIEKKSFVNANTITLPLYGNKIEKNDKIHKQIYYNKQEKSYSVKMEGDIIQILTNINVGGVNQKVIVDSGSVLLVVPSTLCKNCRQPTPHYQPSPQMEFMECGTRQCRDMGNTCIEFRDTHRKVCGSGVHYLQNTEIITLLVNDTFSFTNETGDVFATFGAIVSNTGRPLDHGILGMGKTCDGCRKSPVENIFQKANIKRIFSMWLDNDYQGIMNLGEVDEKISKSITYTPLLTIEETHYGVLISSVTILDNTTLDSQGEPDSMILTSKDFGEVIIDTGTSEALLETNAYQKIKHFISKDCKPGMCNNNSLLDGFCYNYPDEYFDSFPTIHVEMLGGASIDISPNSYITTTFASGQKYRCFGIKESPLKGKSIIGLSWLRNNYLVFDTEHNRMGFGSKELNQIFKSNEHDSLDSSLNHNNENQNSKKMQQDKEEFSPIKQRIVVKISDNQLEEEYQKNLKQENEFLLLEEELNSKNNKNNHENEKETNEIKTNENHCNGTSLNGKCLENFKSENDKYKIDNLKNINSGNNSGNNNSGNNSNNPIKYQYKKTPVNKSSKNIKEKKSSPLCKFSFTQKKYFQWIDNNAVFYTFWECTIENISDKTINNFVLTAMDNISLVIGMNISTESTPYTTMISLPPTTKILPNSQYRWLYSTTSKESISFSVNNCGVLESKK